MFEVVVNGIAQPVHYDTQGEAEKAATKRRTADIRNAVQVRTVGAEPTEAQKKLAANFPPIPAQAVETRPGASSASHEGNIAGPNDGKIAPQIAHGGIVEGREGGEAGQQEAARPLAESQIKEAKDDVEAQRRDAMARQGINPNVPHGNVAHVAHSHAQDGANPIAPAPTKEGTVSPEPRGDRTHAPAHDANKTAKDMNKAAGQAAKEASKGR